MFDRHLNIHGFDLHDVAILAAALENLVHSEARDRLEAAYKLTNGARSDGVLSEEDAKRTLRTYLLMYVLQRRYHYSQLTRKLADRVFEQIERAYPMWNNSVLFLEETYKAVLEEEAVPTD